MAKWSTNPKLFEQCSERLTIDDVTDQLFDDDTFTVRVECGLKHQRFYRDYEVTQVPKPFGGYQWYLVCPITGKRARILYRFGDQVGGLFAHRSAFPKAFYSSQIESKSDRVFSARNKASWKCRKLVNRPHAKLEYGGRRTRRFAAAVSRYEQTLRAVIPRLEISLERSRRNLARAKAEMNRKPR